MALGPGSSYETVSHGRRPVTARRQGWIELLCLAWIVSVPLVEAFRGVDLTDTGFLLSNQYWILRDPSAASYWFHLWLTNLIGGLVLLAAGPVGLFASKLAAAFLFWGLVWAAFRLYGKRTDARWIWIGAAVTLAFDFAGKINAVHYNNLSVLFFAWMAVFLTEGTASRRASLYAAAGAVFVANVLIRLPNAVGVVLLTVPFLMDRLTPKETAKWKLGWRFPAAFVVGAALAALTAAAAMFWLRHAHWYLESLSALGRESLGDPGTHYGALRVIGRPIKAALLCLASGAVLAGVAWLVGSLLTRSRQAMLWAVAVGLAAAIPAVLFVHDLRAFVAPLIGAVYLGLLAVFSQKGSPTPRLVLASIFSGGVVFLLSWGSDTGIAVATYALPLALPGLFLWAGEKWPWAQTGRLALISVAAVYGAWSLATVVYRDQPTGTATIQVSGVGPVLTTPERARAIESMAAEISRFSRPGDTVLIAHSLPLLHYLTRTKPYLGNPWPALLTPRQLKTELAERETTSLPVVTVLAKANARGAYWPEGLGTDVAELEILDFLTRNQFVKAAETPYGRFYIRKKEGP